jgi:SRSO17 transposase
VVRHWLIVARQEQTGEEKYSICSGREADLATRLRVGFTRYNVEHAFRVAKTELGFSHYEGRSYVGLMRHLTLCLVTQGFVAKEAARLRGGKTRR